MCNSETKECRCTSEPVLKWLWKFWSAALLQPYFLNWIRVCGANSSCSSQETWEEPDSTKPSPPPPLDSPCFLFSLQLHGSVRRWRVKIVICRGCDHPGELPFPSVACSLSMCTLMEASSGVFESQQTTYRRPVFISSSAVIQKQEGLEHICSVCFGSTTKFSSLNLWNELVLVAPAGLQLPFT